MSSLFSCCLVTSQKNTIITTIPHNKRTYQYTNTVAQSVKYKDIKFNLLLSSSSIWNLSGVTLRNIQWRHIWVWVMFLRPTRYTNTGRSFWRHSP